MRFYVIMPVGTDKYFEEKKFIIQKVAQNESLIPYFPYNRTDNISFDITSTLSNLKDSEFVLADLSMARPSCYFELGLAQAIGKDAYLIAEEGTDIHQAHGRNLTRFYGNLQSYEQVITTTLREAKEMGKQFLNSENFVSS